MGLKKPSATRVIFEVTFSFPGWRPQGSFRFSANFVIERSEVCTLPPVADGCLVARTGWGFHQECFKLFAKIMIYDQVLTLPVQVCTNITTRWAPSLVINGKITPLLGIFV